MIEPIMFVGIGFLVAGLLVIGVIPLVHARAVRLTTRRLEAVTPLSMAEIQADKDQLRAEFAMSTRRLEMSVEQMKAKTTSQLAEIGKKSEAIGRLKLELGEKTAALFALEAQGEAAQRRAARCRGRARGKTHARCRTTERTLADDAGRARADHGELRRDARSPPTASASSWWRCARRSRSLKGQIESYEKETKDAAGAADPRDRRGREPRPAARRGARQDREPRQPRRRARTPAHRADDRGRNPRPPRAGAGRPARRAGPLPGRARIRVRPLRSEPTVAQKTEADLRAELAEAENRQRSATEAIRRREGAAGGPAQAIAGGARQAAARDRRR